MGCHEAQPPLLVGRQGRRRTTRLAAVIPGRTGVSPAATGRLEEGTNATRQASARVGASLGTAIRRCGEGVRLAGHDAEHSRRGLSRSVACGSRVPAERARRTGAQTQKSWRRPIFPKGCPLSIFGAGELNFRVRDGNGCGLSARVTRIRCVWMCFGCTVAPALAAAGRHRSLRSLSVASALPPTSDDPIPAPTGPRPLVSC